jgi:hypothetical protein
MKGCGVILHRFLTLILDGRAAQVTQAVMLLTCINEVLGSNFSRIPIMFIAISRSFSQSLQANKSAATDFFYILSNSLFTVNLPFEVM